MYAYRHTNFHYYIEVTPDWQTKINFWSQVLQLLETWISQLDTSPASSSVKCCIRDSVFIGGRVAVFTVVLCGVTEKARKPLKTLWSTELLFRAFVESIAGILVEDLRGFSTPLACGICFVWHVARMCTFVTEAGFVHPGFIAFIRCTSHLTNAVGAVKRRWKWDWSNGDWWFTDSSPPILLNC